MLFRGNKARPGAHVRNAVVTGAAMIRGRTAIFTVDSPRIVNFADAERGTRCAG
jgi:hypothetical protein